MPTCVVIRGGVDAVPVDGTASHSRPRRAKDSRIPPEESVIADCHGRARVVAQAAPATASSFALSDVGHRDLPCSKSIVPRTGAGGGGGGGATGGGRPLRRRRGGAGGGGGARAPWREALDARGRGLPPVEEHPDRSLTSVCVGVSTEWVKTTAPATDSVKCAGSQTVSAPYAAHCLPERVFRASAMWASAMPCLKTPAVPPPGQVRVPLRHRGREVPETAQGRPEVVDLVVVGPEVLPGQPRRSGQ
jgi:hypothetical protein